jgi:hypothetical protein
MAVRAADREVQRQVRVAGVVAPVDHAGRPPGAPLARCRSNGGSGLGARAAALVTTLSSSPRAAGHGIASGDSSAAIGAADAGEVRKPLALGPLGRSAHFMDLHERLGSTVIGHFRDLDDPDRFVFLRSFRDMPARGAALTAFFESEVFARNRGWRSARARTSSSRWRASPTGRATKPSIARRAGASLPETLRAGSTGRRRSCG